MGRLAGYGRFNYFTPSAVPTNAPFFYPDVLHDATSLDNPQVMNFSMVQRPNMLVSGVCNQAGSQTCAPPAGFPALSAHQTGGHKLTRIMLLTRQANNLC